MQTVEGIKGIYIGPRGSKFKKLIVSLLKKGKLKKKYIELLTTDESMDMFSAAFTSDSVDETHNYQVMEQLGDKFAGAFLTWYMMFDRFPQLECTEGVKVNSRLLINYGAKQSFYKIAEKLGFWPFITATNDLRQRQMKPLLEDVFEATLGTIGYILNKNIYKGIGYIIVQDILEAIFNSIDISLKYEDLYDAKTRLKELFDVHGRELGPLVYEENKNEMITTSTIYRVDGGEYEKRANGTINMKKIIGGRRIKIGEGSAALKADAQQKASTNALELLSNQGYTKEIPEIYQKFISNSTKTDKQWTTKDFDKLKINELTQTKKRTKYQTKYESTLVTKFCRTRESSGVKSCIKLGADVNIPDSDGMKPLDILFIGKIKPKKVKKIFKYLIKAECDMQIDKQVFDNYYSKYTDEYFTSLISSLKIINSKNENLE